MKTGDIEAFVVRRQLPLSPRSQGELIADNMRGALADAAKSCGRYPAPELFERIRPERGRNISLSTWWEGAIALAQSPSLTMPTWKRVAAVVNGALDALVIVAAGCPVSTWCDAQEAQSHGDITQARVIAAWNSADPTTIRAAIAALDVEIHHDQKFRALLIAREREVTSRGGMS